MAEEKTAVKKQEKQDAPVRKTGFFKGVKAEFKKIIWPSKATVAKETGAVVFFGIALGVLIAIIDAVVKFGLGLIM
ncbi:MAG: preprotein translocase subunit SecE [Lachnospiraceae bacterium]|nr:preprotein translocase subunit SecE [Lachnospiraceae bacterium]